MIQAASKFTITADGINKAIETATADDSSFDGLVFQISGVKITSIELSQSGVRLASQPAPVDPDDSDPVKPDDSDPVNPDDSKNPVDPDNKDSSITSVDTSSSKKDDSSSSKAGTTNNNNDKSPNTGVAGIAIAGLALAAAAIVVSKKK